MVHLDSGALDRSHLRSRIGIGFVCFVSQTNLFRGDLGVEARYLHQLFILSALYDIQYYLSRAIGIYLADYWLFCTTVSRVATWYPLLVRRFSRRYSRVRVKIRHEAAPHVAVLDFYSYSAGRSR